MPHWIEILGYLGTALSLAAWAMKHSLHMRILSLCSSLALLTYGLSLHAWPLVALHMGLLPLNSVRAWQMMAMIAATRAAVDASQWLLPFARIVALSDGEAIATEGAPARDLNLLLTGRAMADGAVLGTGEIAGDARPFQLSRAESRTIRAEGEVSVARVDCARLEDLALQDHRVLLRVALLAHHGARPLAASPAALAGAGT